MPQEQQQQHCNPLVEIGETSWRTLENVERMDGVETRNA